MRRNASNCDEVSGYHPLHQKRQSAVGPRADIPLIARCDCRPGYVLRGAVSSLPTLSSKLTEETPVIGPHQLLDEPTLIVKPKHVHQIPDYPLAIGRHGACW